MAKVFKKVSFDQHTHVKADITNLADATTSVSGLMSGADKTKLNGITAGANNYSHPTGDGNLHVPATSTTNNGKVLMAGATAGSAAWSTIPDATTSKSGLMTGADKTKLNGIETGANNYSHPTGDGNLHVPATGITNNGKVLMAGATAGSGGWVTLGISNVLGLEQDLEAMVRRHGSTMTGALNMGANEIQKFAFEKFTSTLPAVAGYGDGSMVLMRSAAGQEYDLYVLIDDGS